MRNTRLEESRQENLSLTGKVCYQRYGRFFLLLSCNIKLRSGDSVFSGYNCIFGDPIEDIMPNHKLLSLPMEQEQYREVVNVRKGMNLDFDDAYQYSVAKYYGLKIVTMDRDFEKIKDLEILKWKEAVLQFILNNDT